MLLIVTNKSDYTADFLIVELIRLGIEYARFNTEDFPRSTRISIDINNQKISGEIVIHGNAVKLEDIHDVWYRRPITSELSNDISDAAAREFIITESRATLDALWKLLACSWVSHPDKLRVAEIKPFQ